MKKLVVLLLSLCICVSNVECGTKKMNKASEFLKGATALAAAAGLVYLAYEAPVGKIQEQWTRLKNSITTPACMDAANTVFSNATESLFNKIGTSSPMGKVNKTKIFSFITIISAYELGKYAFEKLGNSVKSYKKVPSCKQKS